MAGLGEARKLKLLVKEKHQSTQLSGVKENKESNGLAEREDPNWRPQRSYLEMLNSRLNSITKNLLRVGL